MINLADLQRVAHRLQIAHVPLLPKLLYLIQFILFNSSVPPSTRIGEGTRFAYGGIGVVIHGDCIIGEGCTIGQGVTLGGDGNRRGVPQLGSNVYVGAGARLIGPINIGDGVRIGANAVVISDVPSYATAVGVPARIMNNHEVS
jgi:serine O-acetyltransferase